MKIKITRFVDEPIIPPFLDQEIGSNINGPSLIRAPDWIEGLGKYYLYFADHKGDNIKLAYSDKLEGPWKILSGGTLKLENSFFLNEENLYAKFRSFGLYDFILPFMFIILTFFR